MPPSMSTSLAIPLILMLVLLQVHGKDVGETCTINNSDPGICKSLQDCPVVYNDLLAGISPSGGCGFIGFDPIVCCPTGGRVTTSTTSNPIIQPLDDNPEQHRVAKAVCAENAEAVYGLEIPPTLGVHRVPVNVSRCALKTRKLIVGGKKADPKEFPHMTAIGYDGRDRGILWLCGGTLISKKIVLTAAHCTYSADWKAAKWVQVGDLNLVQTNDDARPQTVAIIERIRHPLYKRPSEYHDIAILKLETEVTYNAYVRPACLPVSWPDVGSDNKVVATGWGRVDWAEESGSDNLLKVTLSLVAHRSCNKSFSSGGSNGQLALGIVNEWQMCAGEVGKDTCQGDSGGPLAVFNTVHDCMYNVVGVTSLGRLCGSIIPGVYTRVYHYVSWIEETAWPEYF